MNVNLFFKSCMPSCLLTKSGFVSLVCVIMLTTLCLPASAFGVYYQNPEPVTISGKVVSDAAEPLNGVTVALKGTALGTRTDISGNFSLEIPGREGILVFSYVGFTTKEIAIGNSNVVNV